jgi:branched-chain amino acid transport system ATP-binding protein
METEPLLVARDLRVVVQGREVVHGIDLEVRAGEIVALVGHNGAGKTSTMRALAGLADATGRVSLDGLSLDSLTAARRARSGLALVPDGGSGVFGPMTVRQNLQLSTAGASVPRDESIRSRAAELEATIAPFLEERGGQRAETLSGGQRQMLALAGALRRYPQVLLLDEPSIGLAPKVVDDLMHGVRLAAREVGCGVVLVEQDIGVVLDVADRILVMKDGSIVASYDSAAFPSVHELWQYF